MIVYGTKLQMVWTWHFILLMEKYMKYEQVSQIENMRRMKNEGG